MSERRGLTVTNVSGDQIDITAFDDPEPRSVLTGATVTARDGTTTLTFQVKVAEAFPTVGDRYVVTIEAA